MAKHTLYHELHEALDQFGCAICRIGEKTVARYLEGLVYETANDYKVRAEITRSRGFCNLHAWQLRACHGAALDIAILYGDILSDWQHALENHMPQAAPKNPLHWLRTTLGLSGGQPTAHALAATLAPQRPCLVCDTRETAERAHLQELLAHLTDPDIQASYVASGGLCLPHFRLALQHSTTTVHTEQLVTLQSQAIAPLLMEVNKFIRKHDYRFEAEMTADEGESWTKALALVSGQHGMR